MRLLLFIIASLVSFGTQAKTERHTQLETRQDSILQSQQSQRQSVQGKDDRNVMLNASDANQPRQIDIGLPISSVATIYENGLPVSYSNWPFEPQFSWVSDIGLSQNVMTLPESAILNGCMVNIVRSRDRYTEDKPELDLKFQANHFGRHLLSLYGSAKFSKHWGFMASVHQVWDPGSTHQMPSGLETRIQSYKAGLHYWSTDKRLHASLLYQFAYHRRAGAISGPFLFKGEGVTEPYNGFQLGSDSYYPAEATNITYTDVKSGELMCDSYEDLGTKTSHQLTFNLDYTFSDRMKLTVASKLKTGDARIYTYGVSGIIQNDNSSYYTSDGKLYTGQLIQNRLAFLYNGYERSWLTTAELSHRNRKNNDKWRVGVNLWFNKSGEASPTVRMAHTVEADPVLLYTKSADGTLQSSWAHNSSAAYYDGYETKLAAYFVNEWRATRNFWLSAGLRAEYFRLNGDAANNIPNADGTVPSYNTRMGGWSLVKDGVKITPFSKNHFTPSASFKFWYQFLKGFGLNGEAIFVRQYQAMESFSGNELPQDKPTDSSMLRLGLFWNNSFIQLSSQVFFAAKSNGFVHSRQYKIVDGKEEIVNNANTYDIQTLGWTTDLVLRPFKGFKFHALLTLQDPVYKNFILTAKFSDGTTTLVLSDNNLTGLSRILMELDPSYTIKKWTVRLNFRYYGKKYINKTNSLYFNPRWETFGGIDFKLNKKITISLDVVNFFNQKGASGSIATADLVDAEGAKKYTNYVMAGSYIRPFEVSLGCKVKFF